MDQYLLNQYFNDLKTAQSEEEINGLTSKIWEVWMNSGQIEIDAHLERGCELLCQKDYDGAIEVFDIMTVRWPDFAEAWNKRATTYYLRGEYNKSIQDIKKTLEIEPRHFGALSGWATICLIINDKHRALKAFEKLYEIYPHKKGLANKISMLKQVLND